VGLDDLTGWALGGGRLVVVEASREPSPPHASHTTERAMTTTTTIQRKTTTCFTSVSVIPLTLSVYLSTVPMAIPLTLSVYLSTVPMVPFRHAQVRRTGIFSLAFNGGDSWSRYLP
jgi:hypothetical protein